MLVCRWLVFALVLALGLAGSTLERGRLKDPQELVERLSVVLPGQLAYGCGFHCVVPGGGADLLQALVVDYGFAFFWG